MASETKSAEEIGEQAQTWIEASFSDPHGKSYWQNRFSDDNMETAYCAGFAAGLEHARKVFMAEAAPATTELMLTSHEKFLLEWLGKEHSSSLGECEGQSLDVLVNLGLAEIGPTPEGKHPHYRRVSLTDKGQEAVSPSFQATS